MAESSDSTVLAAPVTPQAKGQGTRAVGGKGGRERGWALREANEEASRLTRECLRGAVLQLAGAQGFDGLTVSGVARRAGVSRTAFYRNYANMDELVCDLCRELRKSLLDSLSSERYRTDRRLWYERFFATIRDNTGYFQIYLDANVPLVGDDVLEGAHPSDSFEGLCRNRAREGAFLAVLTGWFRDGMRQSPEEMADVCVRVLPS